MLPSKPDVTLSDGREIVIDMSKVTQKEFRESKRITQPDTEEMNTLSKVSGLTVEELDNLLRFDYQQIALAYFKKGNGFEIPT